MDGQHNTMLTQHLHNNILNIAIAKYCNNIYGDIYFDSSLFHLQTMSLKEDFLHYFI